MERTVPKVSDRDDGLVSVDYGPPGPYLTLTPDRVRGLIYALARAGWITADGRPVLPGGRR